MNDLQAQITANSTQAVAAVDQVGGAVDRLARKTKNANKEQADLQKKIREDYKKTGEGVARAGGPVGSIGGRILGGLGMGGAIGTASVALAGLTLAMNALTAASARAMEAIGKEAEATESIRQAQEKGDKANNDQAKLGMQQGPAVRPLIAQGGPAAAQALEKLEKQGIDTASAAKGLQAILVKFPNRPLDSGASKETIDQALSLQQVGMRFEDAVDQLIQKGGMGDMHTARHSAALVYRDFTGGMTGDPEKNLHQAIVNVNSNKFLQNEENGRKVIGALPANQRSKSGLLDQALHEDLGAAMEPVSAAMVELANVNQRIQATLEKQAEGQWAVARWLATAGRAWGISAGSGRQIADDNKTAVGNAVNNSPPNAPPSRPYIYNPDR